jgi:anti-sigma factor RsiW
LNNDVSGDLRHLIPFYLAGSLEVSERQKVEEAIATHPEWQADIRFWRVASIASRQQKAYLTDGHPLPELLVDYADGQLNDQPQVVATVEAHLARCLVCRSDLERVRKVGAAVRAPVRWRTLAGAAVILVVGETVLTWLSPEPPRTAHVPLQATVSVRAGGAVEAVPLVVTEATDSVALRIGIPASGLAGMDVTITIRRSKDDVTVDYLDPVLRERIDGTDWLSIRVSRHPYFTIPGHYEIVITEDVTGFPDILPETYALPLLILEAN